MNNAFKIKTGLNVEPKTGSTVNTAGDLAYNNTSGQLEVYTSAAESISTASNTQTLTNKSYAADGTGNSLTNIADTNIKAGAAIAYSKLALTGNIVNADINTSAAIAYSKLALTGAILNADLAGNIADSKLNTISTAGKVSNSATTATSANTASAIVARDASGNFTAGTVTAALTGTASGNTTYTANNHGVVVSGSANAMTVVAPNASTVFPLISGGASADPSWAKLSEAGGGTNQTTYTTGDILYASASNTLSKLGIGTANQVLKIVNGIPSWNTAPVGGINYLSANPDAEVDTSNWTTYSNTAQNTPVNATGGSPASTWTRTTTSPLRGTGSFLWTRTANNRQGEGVSYAFTIDAADQSRPLAIVFDYKVASGTFFAADGITTPLNDGTTSQNAGMSDLEVFVYDVTNAVLIPVTPQVLTSTSTIDAQFKGIFQAASNSTSYRLAIHTARSTAVAFTMQFDNFFVGPQSVSYGAPITDWTSYTPTFAGLGTVAVGSGETAYRRVGDSVQLAMRFATGTTTASQITISLPTGLTIANTFGASATCVGVAVVDAAVATIFTVLAAGGDTVLHMGRQDGTNAGLSYGNGSSLFGNNEGISFVTGLIPVTGWSSTILMSNDTDTRVVDLAAHNNGTAVTANTAIASWTTDKDSHGAFNGTTFTVPVSGDYSVTFYSATTTGTPLAQIYKNGSLFLKGVGSGVRTSASTILSGLKAGDTIDVRLDTSLTLTSTNTDTLLSINKLSGPSAIAATETVSGRYFSSSTTISGTLATINYATKDYDSHSSYSSGIVTVPSSGKYQINATILISGTITLNNILILEIQKNSTVVSRTTEYAGGAETNMKAVASDIISCVAGDTLRIQVSSSATTPSIVSSNFDNYFSWCRLGN